MSQHMPRESAYKLIWDVERFENLDYEEDIYFDDFGASYGKIYELEPIATNSPVVYRGDLRVLPLIDYPYPHPEHDLCVMSKRMLTVLQTVKSFGFREIPIEIKDWAIKPERAIPPNRDYIGVQLTAYSDVFDYDLSVYQRMREAAQSSDSGTTEDWFVADVEEFVFKVPPEGLPPIFRIRETPTILFISHAAREALRKAEIKGVAFESLKGIIFGEISLETDTPVSLSLN